MRSSNYSLLRCSAVFLVRDLSVVLSMSLFVVFC